MKFESWRKFDDKVGSRGCQWSSLNAPWTKMSVWNLKVDEYLGIKLAEGDVNGPVWMPQGLKCPGEI